MVREEEKGVSSARGAVGIREVAMEEVVVMVEVGEGSRKNVR